MSQTSRLKRDNINNSGVPGGERDVGLNFAKASSFSLGILEKLTSKTTCVVDFLKSETIDGFW